MERNGSPYRTNVYLPHEETMTRLSMAVCALGYTTVRKQGTSVWLELQSVSTGRTRLPNTDLYRKKIYFRFPGLLGNYT